METPMTDQSWGEMVNQVIVHGNPPALRSAAMGWQDLVANLHSLRTDLLKNVTDLREFNLWEGPAFDEYARQINAIGAYIEDIITRCTTPEGGVRVQLNIISDELRTAQANMDVPAEFQSEVNDARNSWLSFSPTRFTDLRERLIKSGTDNQATFDFFNLHTQQARTIYNTLETKTRPPANNIPNGARHPELDSRTTRSPTPGSVGGLPPVGGGFGGSGSADLPSAGGMPTNQAPPAPNIGPGDLPSGSNSAPPNGPGSTNYPDTGRTPPGGQLAGGGPTSFAGSGSPGGLGPRGPVASGGGLEGPSGTTMPPSGSSSGGLGGPGRPLGKPVTPPFGGAPMGGGMGSGGSSRRQQRSGTGPGAGVMPTAQNQGGRRSDGKAGPSSWLYEDQDVWGSNDHVPPPVLNGDWDPE